MKIKISTALFGLLLAPMLQAQAAPISQMRDAATHQQLAQVYQKSSNEDPMRNLAPAKGEDPTLVNQPLDLISQSDFISFNGMATLVPKRAILTIPKNYAGRISFQPGTRIVSWADFFALNRGWITTVEVSRVQAEGNEALAEETAERVATSANLVVATYMNGPISVLPLKVEDETVTSNEAVTSK